MFSFSVAMLSYLCFAYLSRLMVDAFVAAVVLLSCEYEVVEAVTCLAVSYCRDRATNLAQQMRRSWSDLD